MAVINRSRRWVALLALLALALAACAGDDGDGQAADDDGDVTDTDTDPAPANGESLGTVRIVSFDTGMGELFTTAMEEEGFDEANGFEGEFIRVPAAAATETFLQGEADVSVQLDLLVGTIARNQGRDVRIISPNFTNNTTVVVKEESEYSSIEDLEGQTMGVHSLESGSANVLRFLLANQYGGRTLDDYDMTVAGAPALVELFDAGEIESAALFSPFAERALQEAGGRELLRADDPEHGFIPGFAAVAVTEEWLDANEDLAFAVRDAIRDTVAFFEDSDYEVLREEPYASVLGLSDEVLDFMIARAQERPLMTGEWDEATVEEARTWLEQVAEVGEPFSSLPEESVAVTLEEYYGR